MSKIYCSISLLTMIAILISAGCNQPLSMPKNPPAPTALSLEDWKKLPIPEKYDEAAFERLRLADPKLMTDRAWRAFMKQEIMPERNKDIPNHAATSKAGSGH